MPNQEELQMPTAASLAPQQADPQAETPVQMNVQTGTDGLIDDVADGSATAAQPSDNGQSSAAPTSTRDAFAALLQNAMQQASAQAPAQAAPAPAPTPEAAPQQPAPEPVSAPAPQTETAAQPFTAQPMSKDDLRSVLAEEIQKAIANGQAPALAQQDMASAVAGGIEEAPTLEPEPTYNIPDIESDEFYAKFSENPGEAIMEVAEAMSAQKTAELQKRLQPLLEQSEIVEKNRRVQDAIKQFADRGYNDFGKYRDTMANVLREGNLNAEDPNSYELAYGRAKMSDQQQMIDQLRATQGRTLADYMGDQDARQQMAGNEEIKRMVINEYLKGLSEGKSPSVITDGTANTPSGTAPKKAQNFKEAGEMFRKML